MSARTAALFLCCFIALPAIAGDQEAWSSFIGWYRNYTGSPMPADVMRSYSAELQRDGMTAEEAQARLLLIRKLAAANPREMLEVHFANVYRRHSEVFSQEPSLLVLRVARSVKPGRALDAGMGQGRNAIALAKLGWDVTGYDLCEEGLAIAREQAAMENVKVNAVKSFHEEFDFGQSRWDLIVLAYSFANLEDAGLVRKLTESLAPGGLVVVEQFNSGSLAPGPANALFKSFAHLRVIQYEDAVGPAEWSKQPARLGRLVAQKQ